MGSDVGSLVDMQMEHFLCLFLFSQQSGKWGECIKSLRKQKKV